MTVKQLIAILHRAYNEDAEVVIWAEGKRQLEIQHVITYLEDKVFIDIVKEAPVDTTAEG